MEILFCRNIDKPDYYLLYRGRNRVNAERMLRIFTHTGEFENSGYPQINVELAYILKTELDTEFFNFLVDNVSSNCIEHPPYNCGTYKAWYEFKQYDPEKWVKDFEEYQIAKKKELTKNMQYAIQKSLF